MADIVTGTVTGLVDESGIYTELANVRREQEHNTGILRHEGSDDASAVKEAVKETGWKTVDRITSSTDRITDQDTAYFIAGQSVNFQTATALAALKASTDAAFVSTQGAIQLEAAKNATATALGQAQLMQTIVADGAATRSLINTNTIDELRNKAVLDKIDCCCEKNHGHHEGRREGSFHFGPPLTATVPM